MAGVLHKLLRKSSASSLRVRTITSFSNPHSSNLSLPSLLLVHQPHLTEIKLDDPNNLNPLNIERIKLSQPLQFYPSFPFGYYLNPISSTGLDQSHSEEPEEVSGSDGAQTVWADSVKKKRKKKMNKHKYKKLRKRLRRKT